MSDPVPQSKPATTAMPTDSLTAALARQQQLEKRLNKITIVVAVIVALIISVMAANQNVYSLLATFVVSGGLLIMASVYQRSLGLLLGIAVVFCMVDNLLSHQLRFDQAHLVLQLVALGSFTLLFKLTRPYLLRLMQGF